MCGIAGIVDFAGVPIDARLVRAMCDALRHRGPDDQGIVDLGVNGQRSRAAAVVFGNRRLSIIDVAGGHQPIPNEDRTVWTVLNGEIYNYRTLRDELESNGHQFATRTDTEVIVHAYETYGDAFVEHLDGMFALAIWDTRRQRLLLARDRLGMKPLVYVHLGSRLTFASELQALFAVPDIPRDIDPVAIGNYLTYMAIPAPRTVFRAARKIPPAHVLTLEDGHCSLRRYWTLAFEPKRRLSDTDAAERVVELLRDAVRKRLMSDVPIGAFLSGGVDSSAVVALMAGLSDRPVKTFSVGFEEESYDERPHARRVAEVFGCNHHEFVVQPRAVEVLPRLVRHFGEPFADSSAVPTSYVAGLTREHVTVALNGDGGDEAFGGYGRHLANALAERFAVTPIAGPLRWAVKTVVRSSRDGRGRRSRLKRFVEAAAWSRAERYRAWAGVFSPELATQIFPPAAGADAGVAEIFDRHRFLDPVDSMLAVDTEFYLPTDLLVKMDITSMMHSLEARSPFLDHHLLEFSARLPSHQKVRRLTTKFILKRAMRGLVPVENLTREKRGFTVPVGRWLRGELRDCLTDHLLSSKAAADGFICGAAVERLVREHLTETHDRSHQLWTLLMLEMWWRTSNST